ncbi:hypothetical protein EK21DRAFT_76948, partial [Setomelanomma holmii]
EARNRVHSPLLRLPGELRNKIYAYALSDTIVTVFGPRGSKPYHLFVQVPGPIPGLEAATNPFILLGSLLFRCITFHIHSDGSFIQFLNELSDKQRDAITNVQLTTPDAREGGRKWAESTHFPGSDERAQSVHLDYLEWANALPFDRLPGLKRVEVEEDHQLIYNSLDENYLRWGIQSLVKGREVEIVVPLAPYWSFVAVRSNQ